MGIVSRDTRAADSDSLSNRTSRGRWRAQFPYRWDADDMVSRRELLRLAVMASGALFAATGILAAVGYTRDRVRGEEQQIALASEVAVGGVHYFDYVDDQKAILLRLDEEQFVAYSGKCTHLSCAVYWHAERGELVCPCHEGVFDPRTGSVTAGPPPRPLERIVLRREGDAIIAVEQVPA